MAGVLENLQENGFLDLGLQVCQAVVAEYWFESTGQRIFRLRWAGLRICQAVMPGLFFSNLQEKGFLGLGFVAYQTGIWIIGSKLYRRGDQSTCLKAKLCEIT